jgi:hypothetical protein
VFELAAPDAGVGRSESPFRLGSMLSEIGLSITRLNLPKKLSGEFFSVNVFPIKFASSKVA